jgi:3-hydroxyacyl-[acyl-carrier-protein] dehydratase
MRFVLVDRILQLVPGERIEAERAVPHDDDYFEDHFPGFPVVPGVLLVECMGQTAAKCLDAQALARGKAMLARIMSASFRRWVRPGDLLRMRATIVANADRFATAECEAQVGSSTVAQARLFFSFMPMASFGPGFRDPVLDEFLARAVQ